MRETSFQCYYILLPSYDRVMLLRRLAGPEEVIHVPDVNQSFEFTEAKDVRDFIKSSLLEVVCLEKNNKPDEEGQKMLRDNEQLSKYRDTKSARGIMLGELKKLTESNPLFHDKLNFPTLKKSRLWTLINQSLNQQHQLCKNPKPNPDIKTLLTIPVDSHCQMV